MTCEFSALNQKISSLSENLEKAVNDNVDLLHENITILEKELAQNNEIIKSLMKILKSTVFGSLSAARDDLTISDLHHEQQQQSQELLEQNRQMMHEQQQHQHQQQEQQS